MACTSSSYLKYACLDRLRLREKYNLGLENDDHAVDDIYHEFLEKNGFVPDNSDNEMFINEYIYFGSRSKAMEFVHLLNVKYDNALVIFRAAQNNDLELVRQCS